MMKRLNLIVIALAAAALVGLLVAMSRSVEREGWQLEGKVLTIYGPDYTLERLAADLLSGAVGGDQLRMSFFQIL